MLKPTSVAASALLTALVAFGPMSTDMYLPSLPSMTVALNTDVEHVQWTLSIFLLGFAFAQLIYGPLSDRFGRRRVLLGGITLFAAAGIACALATTIETLIVARFFQAVGGCSGPVLARAVVRDVHGRQGAARIMAHMGTAMALAPLVAPLLGGWLVTVSGWAAIFWILGGMGAVLLVLVAFLLPETNANPDPEAIHPGRMIRNYTAMLSHRPYLGFMLANAGGYAGIFAFISGSSYVFIDILHLSPPVYGLCFGGSVLGFMTGTQIAGRLSGRVALENLMRAGAVLSAVSGLLGLGLVLSGVVTVPTLILCSAALFAGTGLVMPNSMAGAIGPFPQMAGAASALLGFVQMALSAGVGWLVAALHNGTAVPMVGAMAGAGLFTLAAAYLLAPKPHEIN